MAKLLFTHTNLIRARKRAHGAAKTLLRNKIAKRITTIALNSFLKCRSKKRAASEVRIEWDHLLLLLIRVKTAEYEYMSHIVEQMVVRQENNLLVPDTQQNRRKSKK